MFSTELLPVPRNINSCSSIADHYHGDNMIGPLSHVYVCPMQYVILLTHQTDSIELEFSFGEEMWSTHLCMQTHYCLKAEGKTTG